MLTKLYSTTTKSLRLHIRLLLMRKQTGNLVGLKTTQSRYLNQGYMDWK